MPGRWVFGSRKDFLHAEEKKVVAESRASVASATTFLRELAALPPPPEIAGDDAESSRGQARAGGAARGAGAHAGGRPSPGEESCPHTPAGAGFPRSLYSSSSPEEVFL